MTPELQRAVKRYHLWFGSYKRSGELVNVEVWLTIDNGQIAFLTPGDSYKVKRIRANPRVICHIGARDGPAISGVAEIVMGSGALWRVYRAYWKTHPFVMVFLALPMRWRIKAHKNVVVRVRPDDPNPLLDITDPPA